MLETLRAVHKSADMLETLRAVHKSETADMHAVWPVPRLNEKKKLLYMKILSTSENDHFH